jgi:hypothetical protein
MRLLDRSADRTPAGLSKEFLPAFAKAESLQEMRDLLTDAVLAGAALAIAGEGEPAVGSSDDLTARQRSLVALVGAYGYRVTLRCER